MQLYYDRSTTPLLFHNFIRFFWLPLSVITNIGTLSIQPYLYETEGSGIGVIADLAMIVLAIISFIGFLNWESYGWKCFRIMIFTMLGIGIVGVVLWTVLAFLTGDSYDYEIGYNLGYSFSYLIVGLAFGIPTLRYYKRRKPLFFPEMQPPVTEEMVVSYVDPSLTQNIETNNTYPTPKAHFCRHCGVEIAPDAEFCHRCGTKVIHVQHAE